MSELDLAQLIQQLETLKHLTPEQLAFISVFYGGQIAAALFTARTISLFMGRQLGVTGPTCHSKFPRIPWRTPYKAYLGLKTWYERVFHLGKRSTGGFAGMLAMLTLTHASSKIFIGRAYSHGLGLLQPVSLDVKRHLMFYAMTGSSKTTSIISMIAAWHSSAIVIDPKSQIINALADRDWRQWYTFAPYAEESDYFNPLDVIKEAMAREGRQAAVRWALRIAEAIIVTPSGSRTPYFTDVSRQYLAALILHVLTVHPENEHNLPFVRDLIVNGYTVHDEFGRLISTAEEAQTMLLQAMMNNAAFDVIAGGAHTLVSASGETGGNVVSTLQEQTKWLDIPEVRAVMRTSTFSLSWLKTRNDVVIALAAPIFSLRQELAPLSRLMTNLTAYTFEAVQEKKGLCLAIWDELPSQGYNATLEVMLAVMRSMGLIVVAIAQNVELMKKHYPQSWKSFSGEADATIWAGGNHQDSVEHLRLLLGRKTLVEKDPYTGRKSHRDVDVMTADQIRRFLDPDSGNVIVTRAGARPLKLKAPYYFKELPVWQYAPDPDHKEALLRRLSRFLFDRKVKRPTEHAPIVSKVESANQGRDAPPQPIELDANVIPFPQTPAGDQP
ncbi:Conjugal transfer protein TraG [Halioglobus japonicus]|nr:Conjugal transfer protein TraG [Halioglobus japonicus]